MSLYIIHEGKAYQGDGSVDLIKQICDWKFDGNQIVYKFKGYKEYRGISISNEFTYHEKIVEASRWLMRMMPESFVVAKEVARV